MLNLHYYYLIIFSIHKKKSFNFNWIIMKHQNLPGLSKYFLNENKTKLIKAHSTQRKSLADSGPAQFHIWLGKDLFNMKV